MNTIEYTNEKIKSNKLLFKIILGVVAISIIFGSMLVIQKNEEKHKERLYINWFYSKLNDCIPSVSSSWFYEVAFQLSNRITEQVELSLKIY